MQFKVYHANNPNFGFGEHPEFGEDTFTHVANVECDRHGEVFRLTNHIDDDWGNNKGVEALVERRRSTSVGDVVVGEDGTRYRCEMMGWTEF